MWRLHSSRQMCALPVERVDLENSGPRERLALLGAESLDDVSLVAVLLGTGSRAMPVATLAANLLHAHGGLRGITSADPYELASHPGLGLGKATRLIAAGEIARRLRSHDAGPVTRFGSSDRVASYLRPRFENLANEHFYVIGLDVKNNAICERCVAQGGINQCTITPADIFRPLIRAGAIAVILAHNHPSGDPTPSNDDARLTAQMWSLGRSLGVEVVDHVIVGRSEHFSFADAGLFGEAELVHTNKMRRAK